MRFGVDVGGTSVKIGLVDQNKIIDKYEIPTKKESLIKDICESLLDYMKKHNIEQVEGIGFGFPGTIIKNYIYDLTNVGIKNMDLIQEVSKYFPNTKVSSGNDANVAALGEMLYHQEYENACMITLGTGVGCGIILDGHILEGRHGTAGEVGHMVVAEDYHFPCACGLNGCLETVASATGVVRLAKFHFHEFETALPESFTAKDVFDLARKEDPLCVFVVDRVSYYIAKCISILSLTVDVDVYYIGGGVSRAGDILLHQIKKHFQKLAYNAVKNVDIEIATLLNDAGMLGAAGLLN